MMVHPVKSSTLSNLTLPDRETQLPGSEYFGKMSEPRISAELSKKIEGFDKTDLKRVESKDEGGTPAQARNMTLAG